MDYSPWGRKELDMTERLSLSREALQSSGEGIASLLKKKKKVLERLAIKIKPLSHA